MNTKKHGFTLIEMLVVLAVLAALAAILFPVFASVRHRARMTACASNLHQISLALHQYEVDNDNRYPPNNNCVGNQPQLVWELLTPYMRNKDVLHCPDERYGQEAQTHALANGYLYRSLFINMVTLQKPLLPSPGTVVAFCPHHVGTNSGEAAPIIVVHEDGSVAQISSDQVEDWFYHAGQWYPAGRFKIQIGDETGWRFPGEPWPPEFQP